MYLFGHYIRRSILLLMGVEAGLLFFFLALLLPVQYDLQGLDAAAFQFKLELLVVVALMTLSMVLFGLYDAQQIVMRDGMLMVVLRIVVALAIVAGISLLLIELLPDLELEQRTLLSGLTLSGLVLIGERWLYHRVVRSPHFKRRVLVLGVGSRAAYVAELQGERCVEELPYTVVGFLDLEQSGAVDVSVAQVIYRTGEESILDLARSWEVDELVVAVRDRRGKLPIRELLDCKLHEINVTDLSSFIERERRYINLDSLNTSWLVFGDGFRRDASQAFIKRSGDVLFSLVLLILSTPVMLLTTLAIKLESRGPVFYRQERVGRGNQPYWLYKFRSMREDAEKDGVPRWAQSNDDRITRVGGVIRKLRIDELPQLLNVLRGDMSLVGPRPERPLFTDQLSANIPYYNVRHSLRPGITGWSQVCYPYGASVEDARYKLQYDLYYLKNHNFFLDLLIIFRTVGVVSFGEGSR